MVKTKVFCCVVLVMLLTLAISGIALAGPPLHKASGGGTVEWGAANTTVTYGFTAKQVSVSGNATGEAQFQHRDVPPFPLRNHADILYLSVNPTTGDAWMGGVITQSNVPQFVGWEIVWRVQDNGEGSKASGPDMTSSVMFAPAITALNQPPLYLIPWTNGNVQVR